MELNLQQRVCIKFCVKNGFKGMKTLEMLRNCFGSDTLKKSSTLKPFMSGMNASKVVVSPRMTNAVAGR